MAIILDKPGFGSQLGSSFGTGLSKALEGLAQNKFQQMQQRNLQQRQARGLSSLFPQQQAEQLAEFDPLVLREILKQQLPMLQESQLSKLVEGIAGNAEVEDNSVARMLSGQQTQQEITPEAIKTEQIRPKEAQYKSLAPGAIAAQEMQKLELRLNDPRINSAQKAKLRGAIESRQEKFEKKQELIDKNTNPFVEKINSDYEVAQAGDQRINRMKELIKEGNLSNPAFASVLDTLEHVVPSLGIGINLKWLLTPESQEFDKLSKDFLKDVKKIFGARVTDNEVRSFLKTIPTLSQSNEGKLRIINNMQLFNEASKSKKDVLNEILEENGGFRPRNIDQLVEKRSKKKIDEIAKRFEGGISKEQSPTKHPVERVMDFQKDTFGFENPLQKLLNVFR